MINDKIMKLDKLTKTVDKLKKKGKKIVTTNGVFDILHLGHVKYLEKARKLGDILIVGVNSNSSVKTNKGDKRPINNENARIGIVAALQSVDYAFIFDEKEPSNWLSKIKPNVHVKAGDYKISEIVEKDAVEKSGGKIIIAKVEKGFSTTSTIKRICEVYKNQ